MLGNGSQFRVVTGDAPLRLLDRLDEDTRVAAPGPFDDEVVIVQSRGMERWLRLRLAERRGAAAALRLPFPIAYCRELADILAGGARHTVDPRFDEQALLWRIAALLDDPVLRSAPVFAPLASYLTDADALTRHGLARQLAGRFDEYRLYRPDLLLAWEQGRQPLDTRHARWQAELWQRLVADAGPAPNHFARWITDAIHHLAACPVAPEGLPTRVALFGLSTLPPLVARLLRTLARFVPVTAYVLTPSPAGWRPGAARHPLEEAFGGTSRALLADLTVEGAPVEHLTAPLTTADSLLARVQRAVRTGTCPAVRDPIDPQDRSLLIHDCHSPLRELEVLRDQLLDAFAADETLRPHDVLVMVPDLERYAPIASVVFGDPAAALGEGAEDRIVLPFRIADRAAAGDGSPARALTMLLDLVPSRFAVGDVLDLLALAPVHRAAGIAPADLERVIGWVRDAGIRWGRDGRDREERGLPPVEAFSWRDGLDRLLAGQVTGRVDGLVAGLRPVAGDTLGDPPLLGALAEWVDGLAARVEALRSPRPLAAWSRTMLDQLSWLVTPDTNAERRGVERVQQALVQLGQMAGAPLGDVADRPVPFDVARRWLASALDGQGHDAGFLTGPLTLCAIKPMRAIPFRIIALLGLDDRAFPRRDRRAAFDLISVAPHPGDRDPKADDHQLVLETLLCAEQRLHLSWVGHSQQTNAEIAPSVVLSRLLDHLDAHYEVRRGPASAPSASATSGAAGPPVSPARAHVLLSHGLQPFHPAYFTGEDPRRFSYHRLWARSLEAARGRTDPVPFQQALPRPPAGDRAAQAAVDEPIPLDALIEVWCDPSQFHCRRVLQLRLPSGKDPLPEDEPTVVQGLDKYLVQTAMLDRLLQAGPAGASERVREERLLLASGHLPPGALGPAWYEALRGEFDQVIGPIGTPVFHPPIDVEVAGPTWVLTGRLDGLTAGGLLRIRASTVKPKDLVQGWIAHLAYAASGGPGATRVRGVMKSTAFAPLEPRTAIAILDRLIDGYRWARQRPLPYFPVAGYAYWQAVADLRRAAALARAAYVGTELSDGDVANVHTALLWRGRDPLREQWAEFVEWGERLWPPLFEAQRRFRGSAAGADPA